MRRLSQRAGSTPYAMRKQRRISDTLSLVSGISDTFSPKIFKDCLEENIIGVKRERGATQVMSIWSRKVGENYRVKIEKVKMESC